VTDGTQKDIMNAFSRQIYFNLTILLFEAIAQMLLFSSSDGPREEDLINISDLFKGRLVSVWKFKLGKNNQYGYWLVWEQVWWYG